jgi:transcription termination/antitermination protein NusA
MGELTIGHEEIQLIQAVTDAIGQWTRAQGAPPLNILDCYIEEDRLTFIVEKGHLGLALGKEARNLQRLKGMLKKEVKFLEFDEDQANFVSNLFKPFKPKTVVVERKKGGGPLVATVELVEEEKGKAIGKGGKNVNLVRVLARRHHQIDEVKVL